MVTFLYGGAGSGKTTRIRASVLSDLAQGRQVLLLVPEQEAMTAERDLTSAAAASSPPCPTERLEVLNFSRLADRVFRELGGLSYRPIDKRGRLLVMWRALRSVAPLLTEYGDAFSDPEGLIRLMCAAQKELATYGITPEALLGAADELGKESRLSGKLHDLALICASYSQLLHADYDDPADELPRLCALLREQRLFASYRVYIDSFRGFTPQEYEVLACLIHGAADVTVTLGFLPGQSEPHLAAMRETEKRLARLAPEHRTVIAGESGKYAPNPALGYLSRHLWSFRAQTGEEAPAPDGITVLRCADRYEEAEQVCLRILRLVREGCRFSDMAVIARDTDAYDGILDVLAKKYGIPCFVSARTKLSGKAVVRLITTLFALKRFHLRGDDMITLVKTGLTPLSPEEGDLFEGYIYTWNLNGARFTDEYGWTMNPAGYVKDFTEAQKRELSAVNQCRETLMPSLTAFFESLGAGATVRSVSEALYRLLCEWEVPQRLAALDPEDAVPVWNEIMAILDQAVRVLGGERVDAEGFSRLFAMLAAQSDIGHLPRAVDEVTFGSAALLRTDKPKHVFLLGVNEGEFPAAVREDPVFSDNDKTALETCGIVLSPKTPLLEAEELCAFWQAASSPSLTLTVLFSPAGGKDKPSAALSRLLALFPTLRVTSVRDLPEEERAQSYAASFDLCAGQTVLARTLRALYAADPAYTERLARLFLPVVSPTERLSPDTVRAVFPHGISLSATRLESYVSCAFGFWCDHVLHLGQTRRAAIRPSDAGSFIHFILERFVSAVRTEDGIRTDLSGSETEELVEKCVSDYLSSLFGGEHRIEAQSGRVLALFERLKKITLLLVRNLLSEFAQSSFVPQFFELPIGWEEDSVPPLTFPLPDGTSACVYGKIDRVDTYRRGNEIFLRVVDYKTGAQEFSLYDVSLGLNMQMLLYLFSLWKNATPALLSRLGAKEGDTVQPAGVLYFKANPPPLSLSERKERAEIEQEVQDSLKRSGILLNDPDLLEAMEHGLGGKYIPVEAGKGGAIRVSSLKNLKTAEEFGALLSQVGERVTEIACAISQGEAGAFPLKTKKHDACRYCRLRPVCRRLGQTEENEEETEGGGD